MIYRIQNGDETTSIDVGGIAVSVRWELIIEPADPHDVIPDAQDIVGWVIGEVTADGQQYSVGGGFVDTEGDIRPYRGYDIAFGWDMEFLLEAVGTDDWETMAQKLHAALPTIELVEA